MVRIALARVWDIAAGAGPEGTVLCTGPESTVPAAASGPAGARASPDSAGPARRELGPAPAAEDETAEGETEAEHADCEGADFSALDRSRGEWGEPADDVTCLALNYLFFSLRRSGRLEGDFETLWLRFWRRYIEASGDSELLEVAAPFIAWRGLVMASPVWYPGLPEALRGKLFDFIRNVLAAERFDPARANAYLGTN